MKYIERNIDRELLEWKNDPDRKPLLLRGARQVGKSSSIRHLGESFESFIEVNLELRSDLRSLFAELNDVREIASRLAVLCGRDLVPGKTLLFIDEIQYSPDAIRLLRFFKEDFSELHVAAAGSLLEFVLSDLSSFGVGRIKSLFMYPLSFREFLMANGKKQWIDAIERASFEDGLFEALHNDLIQYYRSFLIVGGMPASVLSWITHHDYFKCEAIQEDIQQSYFDDFAKYSNKADPDLLRATLRSVVAQNGRKFIYSRVGEKYKSGDVKEALNLLELAGLIKEVQMSSANGLPLGSEVNPKFSRYIFLDTGLLLRILDLDFDGAKEMTEFILTASTADFVNRGALAEMYVGWELIKSGSSKVLQALYYWENTARGATAEVDYVVAYRMAILPIEVKSGVSGKMKSLRLFMDSKNLNLAIRTSLENFGLLPYPSTVSEVPNLSDFSSSTSSATTTSRIAIIPLYAIFNYRNLLTTFTKT